MWTFIIYFTIIQFINVILNTLKTCLTVNGNKIVASIMNAVCYGFYTIVIIYTAVDFSLMGKVIITVITNLIGVYISMLILEKFKKDRLWEIVATVNPNYETRIQEMLTANLKVTYNYNTTNSGELIFRIYSKTQKDSLDVKKILQEVEAKYIVHEESVKL